MDGSNARTKREMRTSGVTAESASQRLELLVEGGGGLVELALSSR